MKRKHWSGYGTVNVVKEASYNFRGTRSVVVRVTGNHERGLIRGFYDSHCIYGWIGKQYGELEGFSYEVLEHGYERNNGIDEEYAVYELMYK